MQKSQISLILPCRMYFTLFTILEIFIMFKLKRHIICHWYFYHTYIKKSSDASFTSYASLIFVNFDVASGSSVLSGCLKQKEEVKVIMNLTRLFEWIHISKIIILHNIMYNYLNSMTLQENDGGQIKKKVVRFDILLLDFFWLFEYITQFSGQILIQKCLEGK